MKKVIINYNFTPDKEWIGDDYLIYDRSDDGIDHLNDFDKSKVIYTKNVGNVDYDKLCYLVDNYDKLPDVFLWGKTNLFKYISKEEYAKVKNNTHFTPLLTENHKTYSDNMGPVCFYEAGIYKERNNNWYLNQFPTKYCHSFAEWAHAFQMANPSYIPFAPGGNYILTRDTVHKYSRDFYVKMAEALPYCQLPGEAQFAERSYYQLWNI